MDKIYIVRTSELLSDDQWHDDNCRAFKIKKHAEEFQDRLVSDYRENKHLCNVTRFWIETIPFSSDLYIPEEV